MPAMRFRTLSLLCALAGAAIAQCGSNSLVTPPNYLSNNNGSPGGAVYFTLDVLPAAANGVSMCGLSVHTGVVAGTAMTATVYRHLSLTNANSLTSANVTAPNWCPIAALSGTSAGLSAASFLTMTGGAMDFPVGQYALAVVATSGNWEHRYTNGLANVATDGNITFTGGRATNVPFTGTPFGTATNHRIFNGTFHYDLPAAPVTLSPCGAVATATNAGAGCGGLGASMHELYAAGPGTFDLVNLAGPSSTDLLFVDAGGTVSVANLPGSPIVAPAAPNLGLGDDTNTALLPIGFSASIGGHTFNSISIASNGYVWLGGTGVGDFTPTAAELTSQGARFAPYWVDFNPTLGGSVHLDLGTNLAIVTWLNVFPFGGTAVEATVQLEITPNTMLVRYDPNIATGYATTASDRIVGFSNGVAHATPAAVDYSAGGVPSVVGDVNLTLASGARPIAGTTVQLLLNGIEAFNVGGVVAELGVAGAGVLMPNPPFHAGCNQYVSGGAATIGLVFAPGGSVPFTIPPGIGLNGLPVVWQGASLGTLFKTSNAVNHVIGNF
jgi:hypothetical protein